MLQRNRRGMLAVRGLAWAASAALAFGLAARLPAADDDKPDQPEKKPLVKLKPAGQRSKPAADKPDADKPDAGEGELIKPLGPTTKPATNPTAKKDEKKIDVPADVRELLDKVRDAYKDTKSLRLAGVITGDFDMNGEQQTHRAEFSAVFQSPTQFRHQLREELPSAHGGKPTLSEPMLVGATGKKIYLWEPHYKYYYLADVPKERTGEALGGQVGGSLRNQNLSLLLAIAKDASAELIAGVDKIEKTDDVKVGDDSCPAVKLTIGKEWVVTVAFDPKTSLVRRVMEDQKGYAAAKKQQDVKKALVTTDYQTIEPGADLGGEKFDWTPPVGARDVTSIADAGGGSPDDDAGPPDQAHAKLLDQPAPDFKLKGLDGQEVKLSDLKGNVVMLDFWATWCGPCRASLPHLDEIYKELKDKGLKAYAVDLREGEAEVGKFVESTKLGLPVLMDTDGKVAKSFGVSGIPQTVVIGKDGKITKITVGSGTHDQIKRAIEEAMK